MGNGLIGGFWASVSEMVKRETGDDKNHNYEHKSLWSHSAIE